MGQDCTSLIRLEVPEGKSCVSPCRQGVLLILLRILGTSRCDDNQGTHLYSQALSSALMNSNSVDSSSALGGRHYYSGFFVLFFFNQFYR